MRRSIQNSQESLRALAARYDINLKTVAKWRKWASVEDAPMGPLPSSTLLTTGQEAIAVAFRNHTLLPLDDCLYALQATIPHLTRSPLHRCFQHHGIEHRLTRPNHPWTNGQVERMNRTSREATVKACHYDSHEPLRCHSGCFMDACNFGKRLKTLAGDALPVYLFLLAKGARQGYLKSVPPLSGTVPWQ